MPTLGELLQRMRQARRLSQERLASLAQVTDRALRYWEADRQQPRAVELESVLKALEALPQERAQVYALLTDARRARLTRKLDIVPNVPPALLGPLPGLGDLLRAMRQRRGWTQEQVADAMRVNRATVIRWESTRSLPPTEEMERLCLLLKASPEERTALHIRRLSPSSWVPQLTLEECRVQYEMIARHRSGQSSFGPLMDLHMLALKRQLRFLLNESSEALRLLAQLETQHGWWLYMQGRKSEASTGTWRALNLARGNLAPEPFWVGALNLLSGHAASGGQKPEQALRLLSPWLRLLPAAFHPFLLCDMALYAGQAHRPEEAAHLLQQAEQALLRRSRAGAEDHWYLHWYVRMTAARVFLSGGKAVEALNRLPTTDLEGDGRIVSLLIGAEAALAAGEKNLAARTLSEAQTLLTVMPLPHRQSKLQELTQRL